MDKQTKEALKKSKRNIAKEIEWQKRKYKRFTFSVDKLKGEQFITCLEKLEKTPLEWFKEQVELCAKNTDTVKVGSVNTVTANKENSKRKKNPSATPEEIVQWHEVALQGVSWRRIAEPLGRDYNGIRKAVQKYRKTL